MKKLLIYILLTTPFCLFAQKNSDITKSILDSLSRTHIEYLCNGDAAKYISGYSKNYTDLGGGYNGDGTIDFTKWKAKFDEFILSEDFNKINGKPIDEILDTDNQIILDYNEIIEEKGKIEKFSFALSEGDYLVSFPPLYDSPMVDGWFGIFRVENGEWKIIAGD